MGIPWSIAVSVLYLILTAVVFGMLGQDLLGSFSSIFVLKFLEGLFRQFENPYFRLNDFLLVCHSLLLADYISYFFNKCQISS